MPKSFSGRVDWGEGASLEPSPLTSDSDNAGTDDEIYIGMWGNAGGREFPLSSSAIKNFKQGSDVYYSLGLDLDFGGFARRRSDRSKPGEANDPALFPIELDSISYVYVRKQAYGAGGDDDAWQTSGINVLVYDADTLPIPPLSYRYFGLYPPNGLWFGNEFGHQAWLSEPSPDGRARAMESLQEKLGRRLL